MITVTLAFSSQKNVRIIIVEIYFFSLATSEYQREFRVKEGVPVGTRIGLIGE